MLEEPQLPSSRNLSPYREESGDEELWVLPRHTKVVVTGNNRTKSVLVGIQGVVKKAVGLGGWNWLVLKNGIKVKLQRNALSVLEHPTGTKTTIEILIIVADQKFVERTKNSGCRIFTSISFQKTSKPRVNMDFISVIQVFGSRKLSRCSFLHAKTTTEGESGEARNQVIIKETSNSNLGRLQMLHAVQHHFASQRVNEGEVIVDFAIAVEKMKKVNEYDVELEGMRKA